MGNGLPLSHIKVLDLTRARAGPTAARHLADWGADVIKIEMPASPEDEGLGGIRHGPDFLNLHRNKRSITLNLKKSRGLELFLEMAREADVIVENYRPDVKRRLGIDYEKVKSINPKNHIWKYLGLWARWTFTGSAGTRSNSPRHGRPNVYNRVAWARPRPGGSAHCRFILRQLSSHGHSACFNRSR
ncbi:MAG: hypothetical protein CM1200mP4_0550 [Rhodospirillaceae bacterium]|nr:MAG: hypothetical protein CM1200mP4_0550 [Rhodospirillaceae bacterium]